jgi:hypothetical protein
LRGSGAHISNLASSLCPILGATPSFSHTFPILVLVLSQLWAMILESGPKWSLVEQRGRNRNPNVPEFLHCTPV